MSLDSNLNIVSGQQTHGGRSPGCLTSISCAFQRGILVFSVVYFSRFGNLSRSSHTHCTSSINEVYNHNPQITIEDCLGSQFVNPSVICPTIPRRLTVRKDLEKDICLHDSFRNSRSNYDKFLGTIRVLIS